MYRVEDTKGGLRGGGFVKIILFCVADTMDGLRGGGGFVKGILFRVADNKGGLRGRAYC